MHHVHKVDERVARPRRSSFQTIGSQTWGDADDRVEATKLALLATDRDTEQAAALINEMIDEARKLVERHWPDIEALARRLLIKGRVNFLETGAGPSEDFNSW